MIAFLKSAICSFMALSFMIPVFAQGIPEVISLREITLKEDAHPVTFTNMMNIQRQELRDKSRGFRMSVWLGDRGDREGEYLHVMAFDFKASRDYYFPIDDAGKYPRLTALMENINVPMDPQSMVDGMETFTDYVSLGFDQLETPRMGPVVTIRKIDVPEENQAAFEKLVIEEAQPAWQEHVKGMSQYFYKADRGERKGQYLMINAYSSMEQMKTYFPVAGKGGSEAYTNATKDMPNFLKKYGELGAKPIGTYTSYIIVF